MSITVDNLGAVIRDTRKALGLTQCALAERAGCSQRLVSELERGKTSAEFGKVLSVINALQLSLEAVPNRHIDVNAEIARIVNELSASIASPKKPKPKLAEILEREQWTQ